MVKFAPLNIPFVRRLQTLVVLLYFMSQGIGIALFLTLFFLSTSTRLLMLAYAAYIVYDVMIARTPERGGRWANWFRNAGIHKYFRDFFPIFLHKTADLPPGKNYLFAYHPHGIIGMGLFTNFITNANGVDRMFPGLQIRACGLNMVCWIPFSREFLMFGGVCSVNKQSIAHILQSGPGSCAMVAVGGAQEALDAHPGTLTLTLAKRMGFVKVALQSGASLVPVLSYGENDLFKQVDNSKGTVLRRIQDRMQKLLGFSVPFVYGRGIFQYDFGVVPFRTPVHTVVGEAISLPKIENPGVEDVQKYHKAYLEALEGLYESTKEKYFAHRKQELVIN